MTATADHDALATKADIATLRWMFGFLAALNLAMAAKLFGIVQELAPQEISL